MAGKANETRKVGDTGWIVMSSAPSTIYMLCKNCVRITSTNQVLLNTVGLEIIVSIVYPAM